MRVHSKIGLKQAFTVFFPGFSWEFSIATIVTRDFKISQHFTFV